MAGPSRQGWTQGTLRSTPTIDDQVQFVKRFRSEGLRGRTIVSYQGVMFDVLVFPVFRSPEDAMRAYDLGTCADLCCVAISSYAGDEVAGRRLNWAEPLVHFSSFDEAYQHGLEWIKAEGLAMIEQG